MDEIYVVTNDTGATIFKGRAVYVNGSVDTTLKVKLAKANASITMPAFAIADEDIAAGARGRVKRQGQVQNVDTSAFIQGDILYVSPTSAGLLTRTKPSQPDIAQVFAVVITVGISSGVLEVTPGGITSLQFGNNSAKLAIVFGSQGVDSLGVSTGGNTLGSTGLQGGQVVFVGGDNITLSRGISSDSQTITIIGTSGGGGGGGGGGINASLAGNISGTLALISTGTMILAGGNNITLSQDGNTVTVSAFNQSAQTVQTQGFLNSISVAGNISGNTSAGTGSVILAGGNNITLSGSTAVGGMTLTVSGPNLPTVPAQISVGVSTGGNISGDTGVVTGRVVFVGGNNITLSGSTNAGSETITISAFTQTVQTQGFLNSISVAGNISGNTSAGTGSLILAGGNNITLSGSTAAGGMSLTLSGPNTAASAVVVSAIGVSAGGGTAGDTGLRSGTVVFEGGNNITLSQITGAGNSATIKVSAFNQSAQTQNLFDLTLSGNTAGTMALVSSGTLTLAGGANIILSQSATNAITISASNQSVQTQGFLNSISVLSNTAGNTSAGTGSLVLAGGNNITLSGATAAGGMTLTVSAFTQSVQTQGFLNSISVLSNTAGNTSAGTGSLILAGGNNITLSGSTAPGGMTLTISGAAGGGGAFTGGMSNLGNTSGTTGTVNSQMLVVGGPNITISQSVDGQSATLSVSGSRNIVSFWQNLMPGTVNTTFGAQYDTFQLAPLTPIGIFPGAMTPSTLLLNMTASGITGVVGTDAHTYSFRLAFYKLNNSTQLTRIFSCQSVISTGAANANITASYNGIRWLSFHSSLFDIQPTFTEGHYWFGWQFRSSSTAHNLTLIGQNFMTNSSRSGFIGNSNDTAASSRSRGVYPFIGHSTNITGLPPDSIGIMELQKDVGQDRFIPQLVFDNLNLTF